MKYRSFLLLLLLICPSVSLGQSATTLSSGLIDFLNVTYTSTGPTPGFVVTIFDEGDFSEYFPSIDSPSNPQRFKFDAPGGARFRIAGPQHLFTRPANDGIWGFIGVGAGQLFRATPQNGTPAVQLMMGITSGEELYNSFVNHQLTITMSVTGITNPGQFSYYINDNSPNSAVGTSATPLFSTLTGLNTYNFTGTTNFFNTAFSAPGVYNIDFQFSGVLSAGNVPVTSAFYRYTFDVAAFAVPEPATWALLGVSAIVAGFTMWYLRRRRRQALDAALTD